MKNAFAQSACEIFFSFFKMFSARVVFTFLWSREVKNLFAQYMPFIALSNTFPLPN